MQQWRLTHSSHHRSSSSFFSAYYSPMFGSASRPLPSIARRFLASPSDLATNDFVSPNLAVIKPDECFPQMIVGDKNSVDEQDGHFRRSVPHTWYVPAR